MKALSLHQPWADRIRRGEKTIETRRWATSHRGKLLICSSKKPVVPGCRCGYALAVVDVVGCRPMTRPDEPAACCEIYDGAQAWVLANVRPVRPFVVTGRQRLFDVDDDLLHYEVLPRGSHRLTADETSASEETETMTDTPETTGPRIPDAVADELFAAYDRLFAASAEHKRLKSATAAARKGVDECQAKLEAVLLNAKGETESGPLFPKDDDDDDGEDAEPSEGTEPSLVGVHDDDD